MTMDDPLNDSETDPRAIEVFLGVKTLKRRKHFLGEIGIESGAVIPNVQNAVTIASLAAHVDFRGRVFARELPRVAEEMFEGEFEKDGVAVDDQASLDRK